MIVPITTPVPGMDSGIKNGAARIKQVISLPRSPKRFKKALNVIPLCGIFFDILQIVYEKPFSHSNVLTTIINLKFYNSKLLYQSKIY